MTTEVNTHVVMHLQPCTTAVIYFRPQTSVCCVRLVRGYLQCHLFNVCCISEAVRTGPPQGQPLPPDYGPPPYEATQPGFLPPHVPGEGPMPMPMPMPPPPQGATDYLHI